MSLESDRTARRRVQEACKPASQASEDELVKRCARCGQTKPLEDFGRDITKGTGRMSHCKACTNAARKARYQAQLERERQRSRDYYQDNREAKLDRQKASGYQSSREWYHRQDPDVIWANSLRKAHGISPADWHRMRDEQGGMCYLGGHPLPDERRRVVIDHDHSHCPSGKSCQVCRRGLACSNCNTGIGMACDDPVLLRVMADNLERAQHAVEIRLASEQNIDDEMAC